MTQLGAYNSNKLPPNNSALLHMNCNMQAHDQLQIPSEERMAMVKAWGESISNEQRMELLNVDLSELKLRAAELAGEAKKYAGQTFVNTFVNNVVCLRHHFHGNFTLCTL